MRRWLLLIPFAAAGFLGAGLWNAVAGDSTPFPTEPPNIVYSGGEAVEFAWTRAPISTKSTEFEPIPELEELSTCDVNGVVAEAGLQVSGGPVEMRVMMGDGGRARPLKPGRVRFEPPSAGAAAFSFSFGQDVRGELIESFTVEWRSPTGAPVELTRGTLRVEHGETRRFACL